MMKQFKRYLSIFLVGFFSVTLLVSCGDDDDEGGQASIVGTWGLIKEEVIGCNDPAENSSETLTCTEDNCEQLIFATDGTVTSRDVTPTGVFAGEGDYSISGNRLTINFFVAETFTYSATATTLVITSDPQADGCVEIETYQRLQ